MSNFTECPQCGQRLQPAWVRCPACRRWLADDASAPAAVTSHAAIVPAWSWFAGAASVILLVIAALSVVRRSEPPASVPSPLEPLLSAAPQAAEPERMPATEAGVAVTRRASDAADAKRYAAAAYASGEFATALAQFEAAVAASPDDPDARNNLAQLLVRQGRSAEAIPHFDAAVRLNGRQWSYRFNRARAYGLLDRWEEAIADYRAAAALFPDDHATLYNLGLAYLRVRDYPQAVSALEQAVAQAPGEHDFLITLGTAYVGSSQPDRARATFERFLVVAPNHAEAARVKLLLQAMNEAGQ